MHFGDTDIEDLIARLGEQYNRMGIVSLREAAQCIAQLRDELHDARTEISTEYNGWSNRATWNVALWADNDWTGELEEWRRNTRITSGDTLQAAFEQCIAELEMYQYMLKPIAGCEPTVFMTPDGEKFSDADWDELYEYLIKEPRKEMAGDEAE